MRLAKGDGGFREGAAATDNSAYIKAVAKAGAVLDAFLEEFEQATPSQMAEYLGTTRGTAFRFLSSLQRAGLLDHDPSTGTYRLGLRLMRFGQVVSERLDLVRIANEPLQELRQRVGQTVFLSVKAGFVATCIARLPGPHVDVLAWTLGGALPLHIGAAPRLLLAYSADEEIEQYLAQPLERVTKYSLVTGEALREDIARTRAQGYALSREDVTVGIAALGAPIRSADGSVSAAVSIASSSAQFSDDDLPELAAAVMETADAISRRLGR